MNIKRKRGLIVLLLLSLSLTGCVPEYKLEIDKEGKVTEEIILDIPNGYIESVNLKSEIENRINMYKGIDKYSSYTYNSKFETENTLINVKRKYKNTESISESPFVLNLFQGIRYVENSKYKEISTSGDYYGDYIFGASSSIDKFYITIQLENKILDHNADYVNKNLNELKWEFKKDSDYESVYVRYSHKKEWRIIFLNYFKKNQILFTFLISIGLILSTIYIYIKLNNKRRNRI